jgi:hypothetical protein
MMGNKLTRAGERARSSGHEIFDRVNESSDRGLTAMAKQLDRMSRRAPKPMARQLKSASKTLKKADIRSVSGGTWGAMREHPYRTAAVLGAATAAVWALWRYRSAA